MDGLESSRRPHFVSPDESPSTSGPSSRPLFGRLLIKEFGSASKPTLLSGARRLVPDEAPKPALKERQVVEQKPARDRGNYMKPTEAFK